MLQIVNYGQMGKTLNIITAHKTEPNSNHKVSLYLLTLQVAPDEMYR